MTTGSNADGTTTDKKAQILLAATKLLTTSGLQGLSFASIAKETGLSRQLVRYYFTDLDALMVELCGHLGQVYQDRLVAGIVAVGQVGRLDFFLDFFFGLAEGHPMPDNLEAYDAFFAYSLGCPPLRESLCEQYKTLGQVVVHELAIAHPELDETACRELSFLFVSMMHAHWGYVATLGFSSDHNRLARRAFDRMIQSYIDEAPTNPSLEKPWSREG